MRSWSCAYTGLYHILFANRPYVSQPGKEAGEHQCGLLAYISIAAVIVPRGWVIASYLAQTFLSNRKLKNISDWSDYDSAPLVFSILKRTLRLAKAEPLISCLLHGESADTLLTSG